MLPVSPPPAPPPLVRLLESPSVEGLELTLNGERIQSAWRWVQGEPGRLWLGLDLLESELGARRSINDDGSIDLDWFGANQRIEQAEQISIEDEVAVEVSQLLRQNGVALGLEPSVMGQEPALTLQLASPRFLRLRESRRNGGQRLVLELSGPALLPRNDDQLELQLDNPGAAATALRQRGVRAGLGSGSLLLSVDGWRSSSLGGPNRLILERSSSDVTPLARNGRALLPSGSGNLALEQRVLQLGAEKYRISFVRFNPAAAGMSLVPLSRRNMVGLGSLLGLARSQGALAALNGGFFNRIQALPLGGLRDRGDWLSGPILDRGAMAWDQGELPQFSRVRLQEWISTSQGKRAEISALNSGWVKKGLAQYNSLWGPRYKAITGTERGALVMGTKVTKLLNPQQLKRGTGLRRGQTLVVARGGAKLPLQVGDEVSLERQLTPSHFNKKPFLIQGGPLLLNRGQIVLDGKAERFSTPFMRQRAPRSVVASDGEQVWLLAVEGHGNKGPNLRDTARLMQRLGIKEALNLDGGSSTRLMVGGRSGTRGRGIGAAIHNGLGIVVNPAR